MNNKNMSLSGFLGSVALLFLAVLLFSCDLLLPGEDIDSVVDVEMTGLPTLGSRALSADVETVEIKVFTSTGVAAGTGTLTETAPDSGLWRGSVTVTQDATLTFVGLAKNGSGQVLYLGNGTITYPTLTAVTITTGTTGDTGTVIGMRGPAGGKIFYAADNYVTYGTWRFLEAPSRDIDSTWEPWSNVASTLIGETAQGTAIGTGQANSAAIISQSGHSSSAAKSCDNYALNGTSDWFLPSREEFILMYARKSSAGLSFPKYYYWCSTEVSASQSISLYCDIGNPGNPAVASNAYKDSNANVYPVRAF